VVPVAKIKSKVIMCLRFCMTKSIRSIFRPSWAMRARFLCDVFNADEFTTFFVKVWRIRLGGAGPLRQDSTIRVAPVMESVNTMFHKVA
jgi:hypothetical protein